MSAVGEEMDVDNKYAIAFADELAHAGLSASIVGAHLTPGVYRVLHAEVAITDLVDWALRYRVLDLAHQFEVDWGVPVVCMFEAATAVSA